MGYRIAVFVLGVVLEHLANLEEKHDKHRLGELRLGSRQETYEQRSESGYGH